MSLQKTRGLVLRKIDYSETSQVIHLFTEDFGKVHGIAKGSKRKKTSFYGPLDLLSLYEITLIAKTSGQLDLLTGAHLIEDFLPLRREFDRFCAASYVAEFVEPLTAQGQPIRKLYALMIQTLNQLVREENIRRTLFSFELKALVHLGYLPRLEECGSCKSAIRANQAFFSPRDGGVVCLRCQARDPMRVLIHRESLRAAQTLARDGDGLPDLSARTQEELQRILTTHLTFRLERRPVTWQFLKCSGSLPAHDLNRG